jgi:hypothetical protein
MVARMSIDAEIRMVGRNKSIILIILKFMLANKERDVVKLTAHIIIMRMIGDNL